MHLPDVKPQMWRSKSVACKKLRQANAPEDSPSFKSWPWMRFDEYVVRVKHCRVLKELLKLSALASSALSPPTALESFPVLGSSASSPTAFSKVLKCDNCTKYYLKASSIVPKFCSLDCKSARKFRIDDLEKCGIKLRPKMDVPADSKVQTTPLAVHELKENKCFLMRLSSFDILENENYMDVEDAAPSLPISSAHSINTTGLHFTDMDTLSMDEDMTMEEAAYLSDLDAFTRKSVDAPRVPRGNQTSFFS